MAKVEIEIEDLKALTEAAASVIAEKDSDKARIEDAVANAKTLISVSEPKEVAKFTIIFELYADGKTLRGVLLREGEESWEVTDICEAENNIHGVVELSLNFGDGLAGQAAAVMG